MATRLTIPISEKQILALKVGDSVLLTGTVFTARDTAHKYMLDNFIRGRCPDSEKPVYEILKQGLAGGAIYHCGPVVRKLEAGAAPRPLAAPHAPRYQFVAAGPTTSIREEPYQADIIAHFGLRAVIGKGGMGARTLKACQQHGAVYLHAIGGAATLIAETVKEVVNVHKLDFGVPEAFWEIRVADFPAVVTMDAHGHSLHETVLEASQNKLHELLARC